MPLCLTWTPGDVLYIGDKPMTLTEAKAPGVYTVDFEGAPYDVDQHHWTRLNPGIEIRSTLPRAELFPRVRVQINAPSLYVSRARPTKTQLLKRT